MKSSSILRVNAFSNSLSLYYKTKWPGFQAVFIYRISTLLARYEHKRKKKWTDLGNIQVTVVIFLVTLVISQINILTVTLFAVML